MPVAVGPSRRRRGAVATTDERQAQVDAIKAVFPYGAPSVSLQDGGAVFPSGIALEAMQDKNDDILVAIVCVTVGY